MEGVARKKVRRVATKSQSKRASNKEKRKTDEEQDDTDFGQRITYDVLRIILRHLNGKDLARAAMVCRSWLEAAKNEKRTRLKPDWFLVHFDSSLFQKCIVPGLQLANDLRIKPRVALLFAGRSLGCNIWHHDAEATNDCHCSYLPLRCDSITLWNYGLIADKTELEDDHTALSCLFLPEIQDVKISTFSYDKDEIRHSMTIERKISEKLAKKLCKIPHDEKDIKCVILFSDEDGFCTAKKILSSLVLTRPNDVQGKIAVWGGISNDLTTCRRVSNRKMCNKVASVAGISICGPGISTWSLVLGSNIKTKEHVEKKLAALKASVKLQKYTVGFMFACCGRGEKMFKEKNVESTIFKKIFQNVPLVGSFGGGEFGQTTIPDVEGKKCFEVVLDYEGRKEENKLGVFEKLMNLHRDNDGADQMTALHSHKL